MSSAAGRAFVRVVLPFVSVIGVHTGAVAYRRQQFVSSIEKQKENPLGGEFRVGTVDDIVADNLQTGDILLFKRKWFYHYLPMALNILFYQYITESEFDHAGVVVTDKFGKVWVVENTPFKGVQCRTFNERVAYSESQSITLIPLEPIERRNLGSRLITAPSTSIRSLPTEYMQTSSFIYYQGIRYFQSLMSPTAEPKDLDEELDVCPQVQMIRRIYDEAGLQLILPPTDTTKKTSTAKNGMPMTINLQDVVDKKVTIRHESSVGELKYPKEFVLVRTR